MIQMLIVGLCGAFVTLGATYGGALWRTHEDPPPPPSAEKLDIRKIRPITVPIIADGVLRGYVSAEFSFVGMHDDPAHGTALDPESFFMDEAFRLIYAETKIDFTDLKKADLSEMTRQITANVNRRMGREVVRETLVRNLTFMAREDMPR